MFLSSIMRAALQQSPRSTTFFKPTTTKVNKYLTANILKKPILTEKSFSDNKKTKKKYTQSAVPECRTAAITSKNWYNSFRSGKKD